MSIFKQCIIPFWANSPGLWPPSLFVYMLHGCRNMKNAPMWGAKVLSEQSLAQSTEPIERSISRVRERCSFKRPLPNVVHSIYVMSMPPLCVCHIVRYSRVIMILLRNLQYSRFIYTSTQSSSRTVHPVRQIVVCELTCTYMLAHYDLHATVRAQ